MNINWKTAKVVKAFAKRNGYRKYDLLADASGLKQGLMSKCELTPDEAEHVVREMFSTLRPIPRVYFEGGEGRTTLRDSKGPREVVIWSNETEAMIREQMKSPMGHTFPTLIGRSARNFVDDVAFAYNRVIFGMKQLYWMEFCNQFDRGFVLLNPEVDEELALLHDVLGLCGDLEVLSCETSVEEVTHAA